MKPPIYMDHHATTPCAPEVVEAMLPWFGERFGNPASVQHRYGQEADRAVKLARAHIASLVAASPGEMVLTSGATESLNLALQGLVERYPSRRHIVTATTEHKAVLDTCDALGKRGLEVTKLEVARDGLLEPEQVARALTDETLVVALMSANNEIGVLQPIAEVGRLCRDAGVFLLCDATQSAGKLPLDVTQLQVDLLALSGHKLYGPKGIGALYVRRRGARLAGLIHGGGHEYGLRSGTLNVPGIVGFGAACQLAASRMQADRQRIGELRDRLLARLRDGMPDLVVHGSLERRLYNNLNVSFPGVEAAALLAQLSGDVALSAGSACTTSTLESSHVLRALGVGDALAYSAVRFGLGRSNTAEEVDFVAARISDVVGRLR